MSCEHWQKFKFRTIYKQMASTSQRFTQVHSASQYTVITVKCFTALHCHSTTLCGSASPNRAASDFHCGTLLEGKSSAWPWVSWVKSLDCDNLLHGRVFFQTDSVVIIF